MNKTGKIVAIVLLSVLSLGLIGLLCIALANPFNWSMNFGIVSGRSTNLALEQNYNFDEVNTVRVNSNASDVIVRHTSGEDDRVGLKIYDDKNNGEAIINEGVLDIKMEQEGCHGFWNSCRLSVLELYLPEKYAGSFDITTNAGDIEIADYANANLILTTNAGDIKTGDLKIAKINANAGDVKISRVEQLEISADAGDIDVLECYGRINLTTHAGDISVEDLALTEDSYISTSAGDIEISNVGDVRVDAHTDVGEHEIRGGKSDAAVKLRVMTNFGDIDIR